MPPSNMQLTNEQSFDVQVGGLEEEDLDAPQFSPIMKPAADIMPADMNAKPADMNAKPADMNAKPADATAEEIKPPADELETITINPDLDETLLQSLVNTTRKLIVELYVACENDFLEGITLFESIVAVQLAKTTASQIKLLNDISLDYLDEHQV